MPLPFSLDFPHALGAPTATAVFRAEVHDFVVTEDLGFAPSGSGEHCFLHICKRGENTQWVADRIAEFAGVSRNDVGFAGLKDRWAVTSQWFSVYLPKSEPDWAQLVEQSGAQIELLSHARHHQKLRRGAHASNHFVIRLTDLQASEDLPQRLALVQKQGVPNYFGEQRFGREAGNLALAADWLERNKRIKSRSQRSMAMSAARSWLFNQVVALRVKRELWHTPVPGDVLVDDIATGPLWGRGRSPATEDAAAMEVEALEPWQQWCDGLEHCGLNQERRQLVLKPQDFDWQLEEGVLTVSFGLSPGQYATALVRELVQLQSAAITTGTEDT